MGHSSFSTVKSDSGAVPASRSTNVQSDLRPGQDLADYLKAYAKRKPEVAAMWCFGVGFILGWKLKPW